MTGKLSIVATPIGNLKDVSQRALDVLAAADTVLAEDTRVTSKLLSHYDIHTSLERCDENVIAKRAKDIVDRIVLGDSIAFCSDAGMPCISDPGNVLVREAQLRDVDIEVIPGACALITALAASGLDSSSFYFGGFLPRKEGERITLLESLSKLKATLIFYESPHRALASLKAIARVFPRRDVVMARELTKIHEEIVRAKPGELAESLEQRLGELKGEVVLLIDAPAESEAMRDIDAETVSAFVEDVIGRGCSKSDIAKAVSREFKVKKSVVYDAMHENKDDVNTKADIVRAIMDAMENGTVPLEKQDE